MDNEYLTTDAPLRLNLGCADRHYTGFVGVDITPGPHVDVVADLAGPWPWPDSSVTEVMALDVCEHIGNCDHVSAGWVCDRCADFRRSIAWGTPLLHNAGYRHYLARPHFFNELWRVLKPGGLARIETPNASHGSGFCQDPTHVTPYCLSTFRYFEEGAFAHQRLAEAYGITARFEVRSVIERETSGENSMEKAWKIEAYLKAIK